MIDITTIWYSAIFMKVLIGLAILCGIIYLLDQTKKDYLVWAVILVGIILWIHYSPDLSNLNIKPSTKIVYTQSQLEGNIVLKLGSYLWRSNPVYGFIIELIILFVLYYFLIWDGTMKGGYHGR